MVVGAAAEQPRRAGQASKSFFRGHRGGDTGEIEPVPGEDADGRPVDPEELRYAPQEPRRGRWVAPARGAAGARPGRRPSSAVLGYRWSQQQYYVAAHGANVAIYQGVQADIPGLTLNHVAEETDVTIASLPGLPGRAGPLRHLRRLAGRRPADRAPG